MNEKKFERVSASPIGPKKMSKNWFAGNVFFFFLFGCFFLLFYHLFFCFLFFGGGQIQVATRRVEFQDPKRINIQTHQHGEQNIKVIKWKSPKKVAKFGS